MNNTAAENSTPVDLLGSSHFRRTSSDTDFAHALEARMVVNTAVGIIMGRHDCDQRVARANLQRTARTFNVTVLDLAKGLISSSGAK